MYNKYFRVGLSIGNPTRSDLRATPGASAAPPAWEGDLSVVGSQNSGAPWSALPAYFHLPPGRAQGRRLRGSSVWGKARGK